MIRKLIRMTRICELIDCEKPHHARGLCSAHARAARSRGDLQPLPPAPIRRPIVDGDVARIPLTQGQFALIDAADLSLVDERSWFAWRSSKTGTFYARTGHAAVLLHRVLMPTEKHVDHINGDTLDNRRANLRAVAPLDNGHNRRLHRKSTTGYTGVRRAGRRFAAQVRLAGKFHYVGAFDTAKEAGEARDEYIRANFPDTDCWSFNFPRAGEQGVHRTAAAAS